MKGSRGRLTEAQRNTLRHCLDWSADWEVSARRNVANVLARRTRRVLLVLESLDLVEHHEGNNTFRITDAGRAALRTKTEGE